jgi:hypothetical protein
MLQYSDEILLIHILEVLNTHLGHNIVVVTEVFHGFTWSLGVITGITH